MNKTIFTIFIIFSAAAFATCPLDHLVIGVNPYAEPNGIGASNQLFFDATQKYRNTPDNWQQGHYDLTETFWGDYRLGEPGVDTFESGIHSLSGEKNVDYRIMIKCVDISPDLTVRLDTQVILSSAGDEFCLSCQSLSHQHFTYRLPDEQATSRLQWVTLQLYDAFGKYEPSKPTTIIFAQPAADADIKVDGEINAADLAALADYWLYDGADKSNDYHRRADINRDGVVDMLDFAILAGSWLTQ